VSVRLNVLALSFFAFLGLASSSLAGNRESFPLPTGDSFGGSLSLNVNKPALTAAELDKIAAGGYRWARIDFDWASIERVRGTYSWAHIDAMVNGLSSRGIRLIGILHSNFSPYGDGGEINLPEELDAYGRFAAAAAARYQNRGILWELWNEPNLPHFWRGTPSAEKYMLLVQSAATAIRAQTPDEWIVGPATSGIDMPFLEGCFDRGLLNHVDAVTVHPYAADAPEANRNGYFNLRLRIAQKAPSGKRLPILAGEVGYTDVAARGMSADLQTQYAQRQPLANLVNGVPLSNWYNFANGADWATNPEGNYGILDASLNPKPSYHAVKLVADQLVGYRLAARIGLSQSADHCLVFTNGTTSKIVAWTASGLPHSTTITPVKSGTFDGVRYTDRPVLTATTRGLSVLLTGHPLVLTPRTADSALTLCAAWSPIPAMTVVSSRQQAVDAFLASVASPGLNQAPTGTTLTVEDIPEAMPGWSRSRKKWILTDLTTLNPARQDVQDIFNNLACAQERLSRPRTFRLTLTMPDGSRFVQSSLVHTANPLSMAVQGAVNGQMSVQVENPTGRPVNARITATNVARTIRQTLSVSLAAGQTSARVSFSQFSRSTMDEGVWLRLVDLAGESTYPSNTTIASSIITPISYPSTSSGVYSWELLGDANVPGTIAGYPATGAAGNSPAAGLPTLQIDYTMGSATVSGWKYFNFYPPSSVVTTYIARPVASVGAWIYGDNSGVQLSALFNDESGQRFKCYGPIMNWTGWRWVSIAVDPLTADHWGGANDGIIHGRLAMRCPFVFDSRARRVQGSVQISGLIVNTYGP